MDNLNIENQNGQLVVDSRLVAQDLGIEHRAFLQTIKKYQKDIESDFEALSFEQSLCYN